MYVFSICSILFIPFPPYASLYLRLLILFASTTSHPIKVIWHIPAHSSVKSTTFFRVKILIIICNFVFIFSSFYLSLLSPGRGWLFFYNKSILSTSINSSNCYPNCLLLFIICKIASNLTQLSFCFCCFHKLVFLMLCYSVDFG